ncbi:HisA/HisF-related TIM barrel protein (plasmid) [Nicoliella spurrieriana]|uniref:1-(5-phosphoribosyl)-5-[(5-phosphoribosylamino)methylideneamino] imidazole-4-carboxamide isomerase n=1 Tax=Nicoliella spurrieriana TaxID=2925830 RepID=A0A976RQH9_9LACO|nr:HisA/HisF-related TIM barrel protein [Nicoliella spurrieriana]UQS85929.1 HisA/HisF-related TIM barrel protein [Nicoliella spurrieriana]
MIYPAIDLQAGNSVRLYQGDFKRSTVVAADPLEQARAIAAAGINYLHLVDLDGAKAGRPVNQQLGIQIAQRINRVTEVGGGIRNAATIDQYLSNGLTRVILGSVALNDPELTVAMINQYGSDRITIGIDGRDGMVATDGWLNQSKVPMVKLINAMAQGGATRFIVTDTATDGTLAGPNIPLLSALQSRFPALTFVASGGISNATDITALQQAGLLDVIVGKALAVGNVTLQEIAEVNQC